MTHAKPLIALGFLFCLTLLPGSAEAMPQGCQEELQKLGGQRQTLIQRIQSFQKKRTTATNACNTLSQLASHDQKMIKWMEDNKDWCQIPDEFLNGLKGSVDQVSTARGNACTAAKKERETIARMKREAAQSSAPSGLPGSGVRLPQGAL